MFLHSRSTALFAALVLSLSAPAAWADDDDDDGDSQPGPSRVTVDCPSHSIQDTLRRGRRARSIVIMVKGTCTEDITIKRDKVTLRGKEPEGGTVSGTITVIASRHVAIENLGVTGSGSGIVATEGTQIVVQGSDVSGNEINGIVVERNALATISDSTVSANGANLPSDSVSGQGILVTESASARITDSDISNNRCDGIAVFNHSFARVEGNTIDGNSRLSPNCGAGLDVAGSIVRSAGNTFTNNVRLAVAVAGLGRFRSGAFVLGGSDPAEPDVIVQSGCTRGAAPGSCGEPGTIAVDVFRSSLAEFRNAEITGQIDVGGSSSLVVRTSKIFGDIIADRDGGVLLRETVTGNGTLFCADGQGGPGSPGSAFSIGSVPCGGNIPAGSR